MLCHACLQLARQVACQQHTMPRKNKKGVSSGRKSGSNGSRSRGNTQHQVHASSSGSSCTKAMLWEQSRQFLRALAAFDQATEQQPTPAGGLEADLRQLCVLLTECDDAPLLHGMCAWHTPCILPEFFRQVQPPSPGAGPASGAPRVQHQFIGPFHMAMLALYTLGKRGRYKRACTLAVRYVVPAMHHALAVMRAGGVACRVSDLVPGIWSLHTLHLALASALRRWEDATTARGRNDTTVSQVIAPMENNFTKLVAEGMRAHADVPVNLTRVAPSAAAPTAADAGAAQLTLSHLFAAYTLLWQQDAEERGDELCDLYTEWLLATEACLAYSLVQLVDGSEPVRSVQPAAPVQPPAIALRMLHALMRHIAHRSRFMLRVSCTQGSSEQPRPASSSTLITLVHNLLQHCLLPSSTSGTDVVLVANEAPNQPARAVRRQGGRTQYLLEAQVDAAAHAALAERLMRRMQTFDRSRRGAGPTMPATGHAATSSRGDGAGQGAAGDQQGQLDASALWLAYSAWADLPQLWFSDAQAARGFDDAVLALRAPMRRALRAAATRAPLDRQAHPAAGRQPHPAATALHCVLVQRFAAYVASRTPNAHDFEALVAARKLYMRAHLALAEVPWDQAPPLPLLHTACSLVATGPLLTLGTHAVPKDSTAPFAPECRLGMCLALRALEEWLMMARALMDCVLIVEVEGAQDTMDAYGVLGRIVTTVARALHLVALLPPSDPCNPAQLLWDNSAYQLLAWAVKSINVHVQQPRVHETRELQYLRRVVTTGRVRATSVASSSDLCPWDAGDSAHLCCEMCGLLDALLPAVSDLTRLRSGRACVPVGDAAGTTLLHPALDEHPRRPTDARGLLARVRQLACLQGDHGCCGFGKEVVPEVHLHELMQAVAVRAQSGSTQGVSAREQGGPPPELQVKAFAMCSNATCMELRDGAEVAIVAARCPRCRVALYCSEACLRAAASEGQHTEEVCAACKRTCAPVALLKRRVEQE